MDDRALRELFVVPFECSALLNAHAQCIARTGEWRECTATQEAKDACIEHGERRRFELERQCRRWKRLYQSCLLIGLGADCTKQLESFRSCVGDALQQLPAQTVDR
uniref:IMS import disulfide relay-system CHCH-CHCH-like Cx9C domain-containing protein n=1 Tax=Coccolithus braarudii TaxID=221442 RepID=A0A7S0L2K6_9EUKA|mmetsp:Transcript_16729/g.36233  ORF Transcript_16729/g.36233 Transcript_16729/m.36233 type:complete len:106 (+) Transcript_16729:29-346(+)